MKKPIILKTNNIDDTLSVVQQQYKEQICYQLIGYDNQLNKEIFVFYNQKSGLDIDDLITDVLSQLKKYPQTENEMAEVLFNTGYGEFLLESDVFDINNEQQQNLLRSYLKPSKKNKMK